jgi:hypothetical protein
VYQMVESRAKILIGKKEMGFTFVVAVCRQRERERVGLYALCNMHHRNV